jgi:hypothetical protein
MKRIFVSAALVATCLVGTGLVAAASSATPRAATPADDPAAALDWLIGTWQAQFLPHGEDRAAPTMSFAWGPEKAYLKMIGNQPGPDGRLVPEHETVLAWNPVSGRFEFLGVYAGSAGEMYEEGHLEFLPDNAVRLHMTLHYAEGIGLPFSDGAVAGPGGHTLRFRRTLTPDGADGLRGTFFLQRGGNWENPHPQLGLEFYQWTRLDGTGAAGMPDWAREHMAGMVAGTGRWIASNADYVSEQETDDAYGLEWSWGLGQQAVHGRLFGLRDGVETGTYWEMHTYWHPAERRLVAEQFGGNGAFGTGTLVPAGDGNVEIDQVFYAPDGSSSRTLHRSTHTATEQSGGSFDYVDGEWQARRHYTWHLQEADADGD